jgi:EF-P beta-lysylation protein EpmB
MELDILPTPPPPVRARSDRRVAAWQLELRDAIRDPQKLCEALGLPAALAAQAEAAGREFSCLVPASYLARIERGNPDDPLLRQVLPHAAEIQNVAGFAADPLGERDAALTPGLLQKYAGRALLVVTGACPIHCRYCFRRHFPYHEQTADDPDWNLAMSALHSDASIREIILSGGDPLVLTDRRLGELIGRLEAVPSLVRLRIHTRMPVTIPSRVTDDLVVSLAGSRLTPIVVLHANHARELDGDVAAALQKLRRAGVVLLNQAVLLAGVNDSADVQCALCERLVELGVTPYYLHQLDRVRGAAHFEVAVARGRAIVDEMRRRLPGYAVPRYVQERPGALYKEVLG